MSTDVRMRLDWFRGRVEEGMDVPDGPKHVFIGYLSSHTFVVVGRPSYPESHLLCLSRPSGALGSLVSTFDALIPFYLYILPSFLRRTHPSITPLPLLKSKQVPC